MQSALQARKRQVAEALYADDERATMRAVAEFLGIHWRGLMNRYRDPQDEYYARIISSETLAPPGYTDAQLAQFKYNPNSKIWHHGDEFNAHMTARLQQFSQTPAMPIQVSVQTPAPAPIPTPTQAPAPVSTPPTPVQVSAPVQVSTPTPVQTQSLTFDIQVTVSGLGGITSTQITAECDGVEITRVYDGDILDFENDLLACVFVAVREAFHNAGSAVHTTIRGV